MKNQHLILILCSICLFSCNQFFKPAEKRDPIKEFEAEMAKMKKEHDSMFNAVNSIYTKQDEEDEQKKLTELAKLLNKNNDTILTQINLIKAIKIREHQTVEGAEGITIDYIFNSFTDKQYFLIGELLKNKILQFNFQLFENNIEIQPLQGFKFTSSVPYMLAQSQNIFIPYAVLNLQPGNHTIRARVNIRTQKFMDKKSNQLIDQDFIVQNINFNKPATKLVTVYVEYLESIHKDWDVDLTNQIPLLDIVSNNNSLPDIKANLNLGNYTIWNYQKDESYIITETSTYSITATIGENDNLHIKVEDVDLVVNDFMADIILKTKSAKSNEWITIDKAFDNLKSCKVRYKVE
jgi:hypothetical protein